MLMKTDAARPFISPARFSESEISGLPEHGVYRNSGPAAGTFVDPFRYILIVDDHPMYRSAFESLVRAICPTKPTVAVGTIQEMAEALSSGKHFDCIFLDLELPDSQGVNSLQKAKALAPSIPVFVMSGNSSELIRNQCLKVGATRFIGKTIPQDELILTLQDLLSNTRAQSVEKDQSVTNPSAVGHSVAIRTSGPRNHPALSARQFEILELIAAGRSNDDIGEQLNIARGTVKAHVSRLLSSLGVRSRQQAAALLASIRSDR